MALSDQDWSARFPLPHDIVYNRATVIKAPVYLDGALVAPTGGGVSTISIFDDTGATIVDAATVVVSGNVGQYTVAANTFAETDVAERVRVEWTLDLSGTTFVAENDGIVVRRTLHPPLTVNDVHRRYTSLNPSNATTITGASLAQQQEKLDEAWVEIVSRMIEDGTRPSWVMSPSALRRPLLELTCSYLFDDLASRLNPAYETKAQRHWRNYDDAYKGMSILLDADDDGEPEDTRRRQGVALGSFSLGGR